MCFSGYVDVAMDVVLDASQVEGLVAPREWKKWKGCLVECVDRWYSGNHFSSDR